MRLCSICGGPKEPDCNWRDHPVDLKALHERGLYVPPCSARADRTHIVEMQISRWGAKIMAPRVVNYVKLLMPTPKLDTHASRLWVCEQFIVSVYEMAMALDARLDDDWYDTPNFVVRHKQMPREKSLSLGSFNPHYLTITLYMNEILPFGPGHILDTLLHEIRHYSQLRYHQEKVRKVAMNGGDLTQVREEVIRADAGPYHKRATEKDANRWAYKVLGLLNTCLRQFYDVA